MSFTLDALQFIDEQTNNNLLKTAVATTTGFFGRMVQNATNKNQQRDNIITGLALITLMPFAALADLAFAGLNIVTSQKQKFVDTHLEGASLAGDMFKQGFNVLLNGNLEIPESFKTIIQQHLG